jgi:hypothetical protein
MLINAVWSAPESGPALGKALCVHLPLSKFEAVPTTGNLEACSLGKGAKIKTYCDLLKALWDSEDLVRLETLRPGGIAMGMEYLITDRILTLPIPGISPHMHIAVAFRDRIEFKKNDRQYSRTMDRCNLCRS